MKFTTIIFQEMTEIKIDCGTCYTDFDLPEMLSCEADDGHLNCYDCVMG